MAWVFDSQLTRRLVFTLGNISRTPLPRLLLAPIIRAYVRGMGIKTSEVSYPPGGFKSFGEFFGRRLKAEARPICGEERAVVSPCDGTVIDQGRIDGKGSAAFKIKGSRYELSHLMGDAAGGTRLGDGGFFVVYLHPRDYHRVHAPADAQLYRIRHIPGARFPLFGWFNRRFDGLYGRNERLVFDFLLANGGRMVLIMVAAFCVGNMTVAVAPELAVGANTPSEHFFDPPVTFTRGESLSAFLLGSTVVTVWSKGAVLFDEHVSAGPISMGQRIGELGRIPHS